MTTPFRWGILGAGQVAGGFAAGLRALPDAELVAAASRTPANARAFAARYQVPRVHDSYEELVADPQVDIVYVGTPHHRHMEDSMLCIAHGKAVVCEKPFTVNAREARRVIDMARAKGVFCMEAMWMRFVPAIVTLQELVAAGEIGDVRMVHGDFCIANEVDASSRLFDPAQGGGSLLDRGVYPLSLATMLLGEPTSVATRADIGASGVDDQAAIILGYGSGALAVLASSLRTTGRNEALVMGTAGTIRVHAPLWCPTKLTVLPVHPSSSRAGDRGGRVIELVKANRVLRSLAKTAKRGIDRARRHTERTIELPIQGSGYRFEAAEAMRCVRAGVLESPMMSLDETMRVVELMDRIRGEWGLRYPADS